MTDERVEAVARTLWDQDRADGKESCSWEEACETSTTTRDYFLSFAERVLAALDERGRLSKDTHNPFGDECSCRDDHASWCRHNPAWAKFPEQFVEPQGCDGECHSCGATDEHCPSSGRACGHHCNHSWSHDRCCWCSKEWGDESEKTLGDTIHRVSQEVDSWPKQFQPFRPDGEQTCTCRKPPEGMIGWDRGMIDSGCPLHGHEALPAFDLTPLINAVKGRDGEDAREIAVPWCPICGGPAHCTNGHHQRVDMPFVPKSTRDGRDREIERLKEDLLAQGELRHLAEDRETATIARAERAEEQVRGHEAALAECVRQRDVANVKMGEAEKKVKELRQTVFIAQGEAYLGLLDGDDVPDAQTALQNVMDACLKVK